MFEDVIDGTIYETEDEAKEALREMMDIGDYLDWGDFSYGKLIDLVLKHCPDEIYDEITEAEEKYFNYRFNKVEEEN